MNTKMIVLLLVCSVLCCGVHTLTCYDCVSSLPDEYCFDPMDITAVPSVSCKNENDYCVAYQTFTSTPTTNVTTYKRQCFPKPPNTDNICAAVAIVDKPTECRSCATDNCNDTPSYGSSLIPTSLSLGAFMTLLCNTILY